MVFLWHKLNFLKMLYALSQVIIVLTVAGIGLSSPVNPRSSYAVKESFNVPPKWSRVGRAPSDHILNLQIGLKQSRFDDLEHDLYEGKLLLGRAFRCTRERFDKLLCQHCHLLCAPVAGIDYCSRANFVAKLALYLAYEACSWHTKVLECVARAR